MLDILAINSNTQTVHSRQMRAKSTWLVWFFVLMGLSGIIGLVMLRGGPSPNYIAWLLYFVGAAIIILKPRYGVYLILAFGLMGDSITISWFPFVKNFSSKESILYLNDGAIISPLETYMGLILLSWLGQAVARRDIKFFKGPIFWPMLLFIAFIIFGFVYGIGKGGDLRIALWEGRAIFYMPVLLILVSNLITKRTHLSHLTWAIMIALFIEGLGDINFIFTKWGGDFSKTEALTEHSAAIHMNTFFVFVVALWLYKGSPIKRGVLSLMMPVVAFTYIAAQRRAAFLTLAIALALMVVILFKENRQAFWLIVPPLVLVGLIYMGVFWNSGGALGLPVQAIKSVIAPSQTSAADQSSDFYRVLENINSSFTIHAAPLTGVGFGNRFYMIVSLPDISFFEFWEYITHNSIIWIWMKAGVGGFLSMLFLISLTIMRGVRVLWRMSDGDLNAITLMITLYIIMHFLYAYVDMSWDTQSMIYVGAAMGIINNIEIVASQPVPVSPSRWPWQSTPEQDHGLLPSLYGDY